MERVVENHLRELQLLSCNIPEHNIRVFRGHRLVAGNIAVSRDFVIDAGVNSALTPNSNNSPSSMYTFIDGIVLYSNLKL